MPLPQPQLPSAAPHPLLLLSLACVGSSLLPLAFRALSWMKLHLSP
jgi:hypothetical protein